MTCDYVIFVVVAVVAGAVDGLRRRRTLRGPKGVVTCSHRRRRRLRTQSGIHCVISTVVDSNDGAGRWVDPVQNLNRIRPNDGSVHEGY